MVLAGLAHFTLNYITIKAVRSVVIKNTAQSRLRARNEVYVEFAQRLCTVIMLSDQKIILAGLGRPD